LTYRELNDLFFRLWADEKGIIRGKPVMFIYRMNTAAGISSLDDPVDQGLLSSELARAGLSLTP
jgi:hypothetical protein